MPSSSLSMASVTILILDRYRSSTGLPALVPVCFSQVSFPFLASGYLCSRSPHPISWIVPISGFLPFYRVPLDDGLLVRFVFSPRRVRFRFPQLPPSLLSPSLRLVISTSVLLPSPRPQTIQLFPVHLSRFRFYLSDFADSVVVARGFAEARPHHSPGAARSTGQATANKPFAQYHVYSGNEGR